MVGEERPSSQEMLEKIQVEEEMARKKEMGQLKIFLGYAAGTGKTYAMLQAAGELKKQKIDVVAGYVEPHARPETTALLEGLEQLPFLMVDYKGVKIREFDLDAALERHPKVILVDELAHTNIPGCRHSKRYQDIEELLEHGINVYTTVNIQHLESLNDNVASITSVMVRETIPDRVFDRASQVKLVDIEPDELVQRLLIRLLGHLPQVIDQEDLPVLIIRRQGEVRLPGGERKHLLPGKQRFGQDAFAKAAGRGEKQHPAPCHEFLVLFPDRRPDDYIFGHALPPFAADSSRGGHGMPKGTGPLRHDGSAVFCVLVLFYQPKRVV